MKLRSTLLLTALGVGLAVSISEPARACSARADCSAGALPAVNGSVPINLPGFPFQRLDGFLDDVGTTRAELLDPSGKRVATRLEQRGNARLLIPEPDALQLQGTYTLRFPSGCSGSEVIEARSVAIGAPAPWPTKSGAVGIVKSGVTRVLAPDNRGGCYESVDAALAQVELVPDAALAPYMALVTRYDVSVDGSAWEGARLTWDGAGAGWQGVDPFIIYAPCAETSDASRPTLSPGKHKVSLIAHLEGAPALQAAELDVDLACNGPRIGTPPPAGASPTGSGGSSAEPSSTESSGGCGCRQAPPSSTLGSFVAAFATCAAFVGLALRRRSRRNARPVPWG